LLEQKQTAKIQYILEHRLTADSQAPVLLLFSASVKHTAPPPPQPFYGPFSGTTWVSQCQKRTSGLYGARED